MPTLHRRARRAHPARVSKKSTHSNMADRTDRAFAERTEDLTRKLAGAQLAAIEALLCSDAATFLSSDDLPRVRAQLVAGLRVAGKNVLIGRAIDAIDNGPLELMLTILTGLSAASEAQVRNVRSRRRSSTQERSAR